MSVGAVLWLAVLGVFAFALVVVSRELPEPPPGRPVSDPLDRRRQYRSRRSREHFARLAHPTNIHYPHGNGIDKGDTPT